MNNKQNDFEWFRVNRMNNLNQKDFVCSCGNECVLFENKKGVSTSHDFRYADVKNKVLDYCGDCGRDLEGQQILIGLFREQKEAKNRYDIELKNLDIRIDEMVIIINKNKFR